MEKHFLKQMEYFLTSHAQGKPDQHVKLYLKKTGKIAGGFMHANQL